MLRQLMERSRLEYPKTLGRNLVDITLGGHESLYPGILGSSWSQGASHRSSADTATLTEAAPDNSADVSLCTQNVTFDKIQNGVVATFLLSVSDTTSLSARW